MKRSNSFALCYLLLPCLSFPQETLLDRVAKAIGDTQDSSAMSFSLVERATDLRLNEQYPEALSKCNQAINLNPYNGRAYFERAFSQILLGSNQHVIDDCNSALMYGIPDPGLVYYIKALNSMKSNSPNQKPCNDWTEASLAGNIVETDIPKSCGTPQLISEFYVVTYMDDNFENSKITIGGADNVLKHYELLISELDDKALLVVVDYENKVVWYDNLKKGENGKYNLKKLNQSAFIGRYTNLSFFVENGHFPLQSISIDFTNKKLLTYEDFESVKNIKNKPMRKITSLLVLDSDGNINIKF